MKEDELISQVSERGYYCKKMEDDIVIKAKDEMFGHLLTVKRKKRFIIATWKDFMELPESEKEWLYSIAYDYTKTPINDRYDTPQYYYRFPRPVNNSIRDNYYIKKNPVGPKGEGNKRVMLNVESRENVLGDSRFHFTEHELNDYNDTDRALFDACIPVEVKEALI